MLTSAKTNLKLLKNLCLLSTFFGDLILCSAVSLEILLQSCSDESADVRLNAEECLNRMIKGLHESSMTKILVELFKEIKKVSLLFNI